MRDFLRFQKRSLLTLEAKTKTKTPQRVQILAWLKVFSEWRVQRNEARQLEDIPLQELCPIFAEIRKKDGNEYEPESLAVMQCSLKTAI